MSRLDLSYQWVSSGFYLVNDLKEEEMFTHSLCLKVLMDISWSAWLYKRIVSKCHHYNIFLRVPFLLVQSTGNTTRPELNKLHQNLLSHVYKSAMRGHACSHNGAGNRRDEEANQEHVQQQAGGKLSLFNEPKHWTVILRTECAQGMSHGLMISTVHVATNSLTKAKKTVRFPVDWTFLLWRQIF